MKLAVEDISIVMLNSQPLNKVFLSFIICLSSIIIGKCALIFFSNDHVKVYMIELMCSIPCTGRGDG